MAWIEVKTKRSGFTVIYDSDNTYIEKKLPQGADCIAEAPTVTKPGWTFHGWREDSYPYADVLSSYSADHDGIILYAVFKQTFTVDLLGGDNPVSHTGYIYNNNDNEDTTEITLGTTSKSGWELVGYREDNTAEEYVSYYAGEEYWFTSNTTLYSVFKQTVTVTILGGDSQYTESENKYYNTGNINKASIYLGTISKSGWELVGYRTDTNADPNNIPYSYSEEYEFENDTTLYGVFEQEVQLSITAAGSYDIRSDYKYYNNGNIKKAHFTFTDPTLDDADFKGYSTSSTSTTIAIATLANGIEIEEDTDYYAVWKYHDGTIYDGPEIAHGGYISHGDGDPAIIYDMYTLDGTKYESVVVSMTAELHPGGAASQNPAWIDLVDQDMVTTCREYYPDHIPGDPSIDEKQWWWHPLYASTGGTQGTYESGPCADRATGTIICNCTNTYPYTLQGSLGGSIVNEEHTLWSGLGVTKIVGTGRTIVY